MRGQLLERVWEKLLQNEVRQLGRVPAEPADDEIAVGGAPRVDRTGNQGLRFRDVDISSQTSSSVPCASTRALRSGSGAAGSA